jgi:hypothetical protein
MPVVLTSGTSAVAVDVAVVVDEDEAEAADVLADEETAMLLAASAPTLASTATRRATGHVNVPSRAVKVQSAAVEVETVLAAAVATVVEAVVAEIRLDSVAGTKECMRRALSTPSVMKMALCFRHMASLAWNRARWRTAIRRSMSSSPSHVLAPILAWTKKRWTAAGTWTPARRIT